MKKFSKILSVALLVALVLSLGATSAFATVNITVNRDNTTYTAGGTEESGNRTYTYKYIFRATETANHSSTGGGYDSDGTPGTVTTTPDNGISYYLLSTDTTQIGELGTWADGTWTKASGNLWFKLTKSADGNRYNVEWDNAATDTDTAQAAARWLDSNYTALSSANLTAAADGKSWTASGLPEGYYLIKGETGANLIAATTDMTINEKNSYPTIDKKQNDKEAANYKDDAVSVKVGDTIYYQVEVKVPADANADIVVTDTMSTGLTYNTETNPAVKVGGTDLTADVGATKNDYAIGTKTAQSWGVTIHPTTATKGQTVVITFAAVVNNEALVQTDRKNDVELVYGNYHQKDTVEHDIGAAAIVKYDGATATLDKTENTLSGDKIKYLEATFKLTDKDNTPINVSPAVSGGKGVYVVDATSNSNEVVSDKTNDGIILIYGLDPEVEYVLTETATESGYNLLSGNVPLTVVKAEKETVNTIKVVAGNVSAGKADAGADHTITLTAKQIVKVANNSGTVLPSTGGIGTTIFYVVGGVLVLAAIILLVTKKRMSE